MTEVWKGVSESTDVWLLSCNDGLYTNACANAQSRAEWSRSAASCSLAVEGGHSGSWADDMASLFLMVHPSLQFTLYVPCVGVMKL